MEKNVIIIRVTDKGGNEITVPIEQEQELNEQELDQVRSTIQNIADAEYENYRTCSWCEKKKPDIQHVLNDEYEDDLICGGCGAARDIVLKNLEEQADTGWSAETIAMRNKMKEQE